MALGSFIWRLYRFDINFIQFHKKKKTQNTSVKCFNCTKLTFLVLLPHISLPPHSQQKLVHSKVLYELFMFIIILTIEWILQSFVNGPIISLL